MKKFIIILTVLFTASAQADSQIVLKDWQLGLDKKQIKQVKKDNKVCGKGKFSFRKTGRNKCNLAVKAMLAGQMTIANEYMPMPYVEYTDGKSSTIIWKFYHDGQNELMPRFRYDQFIGAFQNKYGSDIVCEQHITETRIGVEYRDETCTLTKGDQMLVIDKYGSNIDIGTVMITNIDQATKEAELKQKSANQDL